MSERQAEYNRYYSFYKKGLISKNDWIEYCDNLTNEIIYENKEIFIRLKNR